MKVTEADLRAWLKPFVASASQRRRSSENSSSQETSTNVAVDESDRRTSVAPPSRLHARNKVSLSPKLDTSYRGTALPGMDVSSAPSDVRSAPVVAIEEWTTAKKTRRPPSQVELRKWAILELLWPLCEPGVNGAMNKTEWKKRNARDALALATGEKTDEQIKLLHRRASERLGTVYSVSKVVDEIMRVASDDRRQSRPWESPSGPKAAMLGPVANLR